MIELETERLRLRPWKEHDFPDLAALCSDPEVMRYFPKVLDQQESRDFQNNMQQIIDAHGWGLWCTELKNTGEFIGLIGIIPLKSIYTFSPGIEVGWRIATQHWGNGYATEGAQASLDFAFKDLRAAEVVAITTTKNMRSRKVMQRLGMIDTGENFLHPSLASNHPLTEHVLYKIDESAWRKSNNGCRTK